MSIARMLPVDGTINILNPVIATGEFPTNLCAIKLLSELVSYQSEHITDLHVDTVMPNIAKVNEDDTIECYHENVNDIIKFTSQKYFTVFQLMYVAYGRHSIDGEKSGRVLHRTILYHIRRRTHQTEVFAFKLK